MNAWKRFLPAFLVVAVGLVWSVSTVRTARTVRERIRRRSADLAEILDIERGLRKADPMRDALRSAATVPLPCPAELFARMTPGAAAPRMEDAPPEPLSGGLQVRRLDLEFREVPLAAFGAWLASCENLLPPWRAIRLRLEIPEAAPAGVARLRVTLEGVEPAP